MTVDSGIPHLAKNERDVRHPSSVTELGTRTGSSHAHSRNNPLAELRKSSRLSVRPIDRANTIRADHEMLYDDSIFV